MSYPPPEDQERPILRWIALSIILYIAGIAALFFLRRFLESL